MSFSSNAKAEICKTAITKRCCAVAESCGVLLYCNTFSPELIRIVTESPDFSERLPRLFRKAFNLDFDLLPEAGSRGKNAFQITDGEKIRRIFQAFGCAPGDSLALHINYGILENPCCQASFLRGAFLAGGSVTDPEKRYHLELATTHFNVSREAYSLLLELGFSPKDTVRNGSSILYFKQSDYIEDFLTFLGAPVCAMGVMEAKVEKDMKNKINRIVNCDTANMSKVVDAAQAQISAIHRLREQGRLETLPDKLKQTALLRLDNPDAKLSELAQLVQPPITKSAMNHRMRKLMELAKE
ncbi:MAG: DNA-binding protein WhiA [Firmicutes bacterium]|nr:DNA-binding protein WhiA [Bacillota bacterium]